MDSSRKALSEGLAHTQKNAKRMRDQLSDRISASPLISVGIALMAGMVLNSISHNHRS